MKKGIRMLGFRLWRLGEPFTLNGKKVGVLSGIKVTSAGVIAIILNQGKRKFYRLEDGSTKWASG